VLSVDTCMVTPFEKMGWLAEVGNDIAFPSGWQEKYGQTELKLLQPAERIVAVVRPAFALARGLRRPPAPGHQRQWEALQDLILPIDPQPLATEELVFVTIVPRAIIATSEADGGRGAVECRASIVDGSDDDIRPFTLVVTAPKTTPCASAFLHVSKREMSPSPGSNWKSLRCDCLVLMTVPRRLTTTSSAGDSMTITANARLSNTTWWRYEDFIFLPDLVCSKHAEAH
jgi:hypothetical protein